MEINQSDKRDAEPQTRNRLIESKLISKGALIGEVYAQTSRGAKPKQRPGNYHHCSFFIRKKYYKKRYNAKII